MSPLVSEGLVLAGFGMGTVFVFLTLLVLVTMLMSRLIGQPEEPMLASQSPTQAKKLAAITAAIHQHRQKQ